MTWIRIEDTFPDHPKVIGLSDKAFRLHISALCYCGKYLTDGTIPAPIANKLCTDNAQRLIKKLLEIGLWIKTKDGYQIHDYLKHQTSKTQAEREKELNRARAAKAREARLKAQEAQTNGVNNGVTAPVVTITPTPTPTPTPTIKDKRIVQTAFERFWEIYPRRDGKKKAREAFEKALKTATIEVILEGVNRYTAFLKTTTQQTAMPATWLNGERWNDEVLATANTAPANLPHAKTTDPKTGEEYCQNCGSAWPCLTESKKGGNPF